MKLMAGTGPADRQTTTELSDLIGVFPYFQSAYLLLLKGLRNTADVRFESQLKKSALHVADREVLYYLLSGSEIHSTSGTPDKAEPEHTAEPQHVEIIPVQDTELQQTVIESARNSDDLISEIERNYTAEQGTSPGETWQGANNDSIAVAESGDNDFSATILLIDEASGEVEERITYMDPGFSQSFDGDLLELEKETEQLSGEPEKTMDLEPLAEHTPDKLQVQADLIDRFIASNPRIEPVRVKDDSPVNDIAHRFTENSGGFVTETLARIYINQGYYSRAIDIYERLSLKYPEKSSYFAAQIEKIKEYLNR
jgi:hypothetical protein